MNAPELAPVVVFLGPSLALDDARRELDAVYLPPVSQGDVYRAVVRGARAIAIVDGPFHEVPSVWPKEILWAIKEGVLVYGAAGAAALRAAELHAFGMRGVGRVFADCLAGRLDDDAEVAVSCGSAGEGYAPATVALVDLRATLGRARTLGIAEVDVARAVERTAEDIHYRERTWRAVVQRVADATLRAWLEQDAHRVHLQREDTIAMLRQMKRELAAAHAESSEAPSFWFEHTSFWQDLMDDVESEEPRVFPELRE